MRAHVATDQHLRARAARQTKHKLELERQGLSPAAAEVAFQSAELRRPVFLEPEITGEPGIVVLQLPGGRREFYNASDGPDFDGPYLRADNLGINHEWPGV